MNVTATSRYLRLSARKARIVARQVIGRPAADAEKILMFAEQNAGRPILKLLRTAIASAENNHELKKENLKVKNITVDQGPVLKRYRPAAFGRANMIRKPSSHITIILSERTPSATISKSTVARATKKTVSPKKAKETKTHGA